MRVSLDEPLCRIEIQRNDRPKEYVARVFSQYDGVREFRNTNLELLLRELSIDLEFSFGESVRRQGGVPEATASVEDEGVYPDEDAY